MTASDRLEFAPLVVGRLLRGGDAQVDRDPASFGTPAQAVRSRENQRVSNKPGRRSENRQAREAGTESQ